MKYLVLRNCVVDDRLFKEGRVYDLPDAMYKNEKNFSLMRHQDMQPTPEDKQAARELGENMYACAKCHKVHKKTSRLGKRHLKHIVKEV
jgi:hypothetical protein